MGNSGNDAALITVNGDLFLNSQVVITGNENEKGPGGGIYVSGNGAQVIMNGGIIKNNEATDPVLGNGGAAALSGSAEFRMKGGAIRGNKAYGNAGGGGFYVDGNASLFINAGNMSGNTALSNGGGIYMDGKKCQMKGGAIRENSAEGGIGGGIHVAGGSFSRTGGNKTFIENNNPFDISP